MPRKPTPIKYCAFCGMLLVRKRERDGDLETLLHFGRRKYCNRQCMSQAFDARVSRANGQSTPHYHARKLIPPGPCSRCGALNAKDVHHKDGNHANQALSNLERICRSCHVHEHLIIIPCVICGKPQKGLGYCNKHYLRFKKWGHPLAFKRNQNTPLILLED